MDGDGSAAGPEPSLEASWDPLLDLLAEAPRENGTAALHAAANQLVAWLAAAGLEPRLIEWTAHPHALRLGGVLALVGAILYVRLLREGRGWLALLTAVAVPAAILLEVDHGVPIFSWVRAERQHHVSASVPAATEPELRLIVAAHYDTKTDLLDHVARAPVEAAALPVTLAMVLAAAFAIRGPSGRAPFERVRRGALAVTGFVAVALGMGLFATLSGGAFLRARSPGALDDGAACAVALRLAEHVAREPLSRTELEVLLLSGEEIGTAGARALAAERWPVPPELPTAVLNLEILGAAPDLAALGTERFTLRILRADARLLALADAVHRERRGRPLHVAPGGVTDGRAFLARQIPAITLTSDPPGHRAVRGLHSAADDRSRIDAVALSAQLAYLESLVRTLDREGFPAPRR